MAAACSGSGLYGYLDHHCLRRQLLDRQHLPLRRRRPGRVQHGNTVAVAVRAATSSSPEAQQRAFQRFQANRAKRLGTLLPWWDDSNAETSLARSYVDQQLELGISNEAVAVPRPPPAARAGEGVPAASTPNTSRARSGIIIPPPQPPSDARRSVAVPLVRVGGSGGDVVPPAGAQPSPALVYVFWDVDALHPLERDPRVVATEVSRLARAYGSAAGLYAYSVRKGWNWVPTFILANYAPASVAGRAAGAACPVCGMAVASQARLDTHMRQLHPGRPLEALAASSPGPRGAAACASKRNSAGQGSLGSIQEYRSSSGELHRPAAGHQLSLKYMLRREGFDARVVQNADEAIDRAINGGIDKLLASLRARAAGSAGQARAGEPGASSGAAGPAPVQTTLILLSNSGRHEAALRQCRALGVATVVVCSAGSAAAALPADAQLDWGTLLASEYAC